jgi:quercetin dioxygenase-like cupin family protein
MVQVVAVADLPGGDTVKQFEGADHGASVSFFVGEHQPGTGPDLHHHPYDETFVIERGSATFTVDGETIEGRAGSILVVPAGAVHGFVVSGSGALRQVSIHAAARMVQDFC